MGIDSLITLSSARTTKDREDLGKLGLAAAEAEFSLMPTMFAEELNFAALVLLQENVQEITGNAPNDAIDTAIIRIGAGRKINRAPNKREFQDVSSSCKKI